MNNFNKFIDYHQLIDTDRQGAKFTWTYNQVNYVMSKIDRFLTNQEMEGAIGNPDVTVIPRITSIM